MYILLYQDKPLDMYYLVVKGLPKKNTHTKYDIKHNLTKLSQRKS